MTDRITRETDVGYDEIPLKTGVTSVKGEIACIDTASALREVTVVATAATLKPIGYFEEDVVGNGTLTVRVRLFKEYKMHWFDNDVTTPVVAADFGASVYLKDGRTVSGDATGRSVAGLMWKLSTVDGVQVLTASL